MGLQPAGTNVSGDSVCLVFNARVVFAVTRDEVVNSRNLKQLRSSDVRRESAIKALSRRHQNQSQSSYRAYAHTRHKRAYHGIVESYIADTAWRAAITSYQ